MKLYHKISKCYKGLVVANDEEATSLIVVTETRECEVLEVIDVLEQSGGVPTFISMVERTVSKHSSKFLPAQPKHIQIRKKLGHKRARVGRMIQKKHVIRFVNFLRQDTIAWQIVRYKTTVNPRCVKFTIIIRLTNNWVVYLQRALSLLCRRCQISETWQRAVVGGCLSIQFSTVMHKSHSRSQMHLHSTQNKNKTTQKHCPGECVT